MKIESVGQRPDVSQLLEQMRNMRAAATGAATNGVSESDTIGANATPASGLSEFGKHFAQAIDSVNRLQMASGALSEAVARHQSNDLVGMVIAGQKANVAFQAATQVRNRLVTAYEQIMNMPI